MRKGRAARGSLIHQVDRVIGRRAYSASGRLLFETEIDLRGAERELHRLTMEQARAVEANDAKAAARTSFKLRKKLDEYNLHRFSKTFKLGQKFAAGRKPGSVGPIRKAMARLLRRNPSMKNLELWNALRDKPPRGWKLYDNREDKYIVGPKPSDGMSWERFCNIASEERKVASLTV